MYVLSKSYCAFCLAIHSLACLIMWHFHLHYHYSIVTASEVDIKCYGSYFHHMSKVLQSHTTGTAFKNFSVSPTRCTTSSFPWGQVKGKVVSILSWRNDGRTRGIPPLILNLTTRWCSVVSFMPQLLCSWGKIPWYQ